MRVVNHRSINGHVAQGRPMKFKPGDMLPTTAMEAVTGETINLPDPPN
jgi:hypothetical protein